jgi:hypothetical protein
MATKGHIKIAKYHILRLIFHPNWFQSAATQWIEIQTKAFSVGYLLSSDWPEANYSYRSKILLAMRGVQLTPSKSQTEKGTPPLWHPLPPDFSFCLGQRRKMWSLFLTTFLQQKHVFGAQTGFYTIWGLKGGVYMRQSIQGNY